MTENPHPDSPALVVTTEKEPMDKSAIGLYNKFNVTRTDGQSAPGRKHFCCDYFVLDVTHDPHAQAALKAYADSCEADYPLLAKDLRAKVTR